MDPAEYKHVVLGLIFLKYISEAFEERHRKFLPEVADRENPDEYRADKVFLVPTEARWHSLQDNATQPMIGKLIEVIGMNWLGDAENRSKQILGRVYEYILTPFATAKGKRGGQFHTPHCVVRVSNRPDRLLAQNLRGGFLLIEFKRPSKTIDRQDRQRGQEYRDDLEPNFGQMEIRLLGKECDVIATKKNDPLGLHVFGYESLIIAARTQLDWLLSDLTADATI